MQQVRRTAGRRKDAYLASLTQVVDTIFAELGVDVSMLKRDLGASASGQEAATDRRDGEFVDQLLLAAIDQIDPVMLAAPVAQHWHPGHLGALGYAWLSSSTLFTGLSRLERYWRVISDVATLKVEPQGPQVVVTLNRDSGAQKLDHVISGMVFSMLVRMCRVNAGDHFKPQAVNFRFARLADISPLEDLFQCELNFGQPANQFVLTQESATRLLATSNKVIAATFDKMLSETIAALVRDDAVSRCKAIVLETLTSGAPEASLVASRLHMSTRTLQRKLADQGTTYADLVDETRKDLALRYLSDSRKSMSDIAFQVGFGSQSTFTRAFRRWTGVAPSEYRVRGA